MLTIQLLFQPNKCEYIYFWYWDDPYWLVFERTGDMVFYHSFLTWDQISGKIKDENSTKSICHCYITTSGFIIYRMRIRVDQMKNTIDTYLLTSMHQSQAFQSRCICFLNPHSNITSKPPSMHDPVSKFEIQNLIVSNP